MELGIVGLGRMGMGMGHRLATRGHKVYGYDLFPTKREEAEEVGLTWVDDPSGFAELLTPPRVALVMVPAGVPTEDAIAATAGAFSKDDVIIDGGNSNYKDSIRRGKTLEEKGIRFLDAGVSGGIWGFDVGFCMMVGGDRDAFNLAEPLIKDLAPEKGYAYTGDSGSGHFAKMVHNGIEYGMLQAYGEGFEILEKSDFSYDLEAIASLWNHGSVVRSWLLELAQRAFEASPDLAGIRGYVEDSGEGRWTVQEAIDLNVPAPVITLSLMARLASRQEESFSAKVIAALRNQFGGHAVKKE